MDRNTGRQEVGMAWTCTEKRQWIYWTKDVGNEVKK